jgi:hypothetical protein
MTFGQETPAGLEDTLGDLLRFPLMEDDLEDFVWVQKFLMASLFSSLSINLCH